MLVKINGKMVEVGPSRTHKQNCGCLGKLFQKTTQNPSYHSKLIINGHEVDMDNPDDVQNAMRFCKIMGKIVLGIGVFVLFVIGNTLDWENFDFSEDVFGGLFGGFIWIIIGSVFTIFTPRTLQKRLDELKKQGKFPSKR